ncbi:translation elongation factor Ts [Persicirhabdus sediminis]|uniref:Elongation factor Ts n=1 Tax=Persicirhabdus sediminis TaxID=454144 RepID=A0A8J7SKK9_9BACT|nr:translation elongation factor Ts [Persicirhabdus sediminis]MBK1791786.1 elongation factor Ts [Persicirhabdus sediminis]
MAITASLVKQLRDITNAGMMDCKKVLGETNGDIDAAVKLLREKGIVKAAKKASREASEGTITNTSSDDKRSGTLIEINCETDFVAKNDIFQDIVKTLNAATAEAKAADLEAALEVKVGDTTVSNLIQEKVIELGENMLVRNYARYEVAEGTQGAIASYIHLGGKVGVILELNCEKAETAANADFQALANDICLQVAATKPAGLTSDDIDATVIEEENEINRKQLEEQGKPANIIENILKGKINKFYAENCLVNQAFIKDDKVSISQLLDAKGKEFGDTLSIARYSRFSIGG